MKSNHTLIRTNSRLTAEAHAQIPVSMVVSPPMLRRPGPEIDPVPWLQEFRKFSSCVDISYLI